MCAFCLSDNHTTEQCPENLSTVAASMSWFSNSTLLDPLQAPSTYYQEKLCNLFNAVGGLGDTFSSASSHTSARLVEVHMLEHFATSFPWLVVQRFKVAVG